MFPKQRKNIFQRHHVLSKIIHPMTAGRCSVNLCVNINEHSKQQHPAEINPETTLIPFTQEEINTALVGGEIDKINDIAKQLQCEAVLLAPYKH